MPENSWLKVNVNLFSDVWTPEDLTPLLGSAPPPQSKIILAWSGFAWDSNRGDLILYGGGHANYPGNDVYRWHSNNLQWERASLPSEIREDPVSGFQAIDGVDNAPSSAHTYKNNVFLPIVDRFLTWGGAAYNNGGPYLRVSETDPTATRDVGPYLFDPNRADGNKVGGTTGSHVMRVAPHPEIVGGEMWENRDIPLHLLGQAMPDGHVDSCAAYAAEGGEDVVYDMGAVGGTTNLNLYRYQLTAIANPALDQIDEVGVYFDAPAAKITCGYDASRKLFVHTGDNTRPFFFWDLTTPGESNPDQQVQVESTIATFLAWLAAQNLDISNCALEFDPVRNTFPLWCGAGAIWELHPPSPINTASGWTIAERPAPMGVVPPGDTTGLGVLGKWRYAPYYNIFVGLEDINEGHIWIYKPVGWVQPNPAGNVLPLVSVTSPVAGSNVAPGAPLSLTATASDPDGSVSRVEFYVNEAKVDQLTSPPYTVSFTPLLVGTYTVVAVAVDNVGGMTASAPVAFTVSAQLTTTTLQRDLDGYSGASDTYLDSSNPTTAWGSATQLLLDITHYTPLVRFAIFQSEGGPVPDGAVVQSATVQLYKQVYDDTLQLNALLEPWSEAQATWTESQAGVAWNAPGAAGAGTDYDVTIDALVAGDFNPGWVAFDVTSRVRAWSDLPTANYGWRVAQASTNANYKQFYSSEYSVDATLRPKLTIVYAGAPKASTSVTLASSQNPSTVGAAVTFSATVHGSAPTGSVGFFDGGTTIAGCGAVVLTGAGDTSTAQCTTSSLSAASHSITAQYAGDGANNGSTSAALQQIVNASGPGPAVVTGVVSRKIHGTAGTFDLALSAISTDPTTEPRAGPAQTLVFHFNKSVVGGNAVISEGSATIASVTFSGNDMAVSMTSVDDEQYVSVAVTNVVSADGGTGGSGSARAGYLAGDVNQNRVVTVADLGLINSVLAQAVTASNYLKDINASGTLSIADKAIANGNLSAALPAP